MKPLFLGLMITVVLSIAAVAMPVFQSSDSVLVIEDIDDTHTIVVADLERYTKSGALIRGAFTITVFKKPTEVLNEKLIVKIVKVAAYNCRLRSYMVIDVVIYGPKDVILESLNNVMLEAVPSPGSKADKEVTFVCKKPAKFNQEGSI